MRSNYLDLWIWCRFRYDTSFRCGGLDRIWSAFISNLRVGRIERHSKSLVSMERPYDPAYAGNNILKGPKITDDIRDMFHLLVLAFGSLLEWFFDAVKCPIAMFLIILIQILHFCDRFGVFVDIPRMNVALFRTK